MGLSDYKITAADIAANGVQSLPGKTLTGTASENKAVFDKLIDDIVRARLNGLIDALVEELAGKMTAPAMDGVAGQYLKTDGTGGRSWDTPSGSGDMLKSEYDTDGDGVVDTAAQAERSREAERLAAARTFAVEDAAGENRGEELPFDGSGDVLLRLPATIAANLTGNVLGNVNGNAATASSAEKLSAARKVNGVAFDGTADIETRLIFTNVSVAASAFVSDTTYADFPYRAAVALTGVTSSMIPEVVFGLTEAVSGLYAPIAKTYNGGVYIYATEAPVSAISIPTVLCWKVNGGAAVGSDTLTWDGNTEGLLYFDLVGDGSTLLVKVSDSVPTKDDFAQGYAYETFTGAHANVDDELLNVFLGSFKADGFAAAENFFIVPQDNYAFTDWGIEIIFPKKGVYFIGPDYIETFTIPGYTGF